MVLSYILISFSPNQQLLNKLQTSININLCKFKNYKFDNLNSVLSEYFRFGINYSKLK